jgi:hypothetical protein
MNADKEITAVRYELTPTKGKGIMKQTTSTPKHKRNIGNAFRNEEGAIDLASIMVGILVIGLTSAVISATVFAVIPWAQDSAAKHQLTSIATAQSVWAGMKSSSPDNSASLVAAAAPMTAYVPGADLDELSEASFFTPSSGVNSTSGQWDNDATLCSAGLEDGYTSAVVSASGNVFMASSFAPKPVKAAVGDQTCLGFIESNGLPQVLNELNAVSAPTGPTDPGGGTNHLQPSCPPLNMADYTAYGSKTSKQDPSARAYTAAEFRETMFGDGLGAAIVPVETTMRIQGEVSSDAEVTAANLTAWMKAHPGQKLGSTFPTGVLVNRYPNLVNSARFVELSNGEYEVYLDSPNGTYTDGAPWPAVGGCGQTNVTGWVK